MFRKMGELIHFRVVLAGLFSLALPGGWSTCRAEDPIAEDECVLEVVAPENARIFVDGREQQGRRTFRWDGLKQQRQRTQVEARFADGQSAVRDVILSGGRRIELPLRSPNERRPEIVIQSGHASSINAIAFSPDGQLMATASHDYTVKLRGPDQQLLRTFHGHTNSVTSVAFSPDGRTLYSGGGDMTLRHWDVHTGKQLRMFDGGFVVAFHPDGAIYLSGSELRDLNDGRLIRTFDRPASGSRSINCVAFRPYSSQVLTAETEEFWKPLESGGKRFEKAIHALCLWDSVTGALLKSYENHTGYGACVEFSPDGATMVSGSINSDIGLWDVDGGRPLHTLEGHRGGATDVTFAPDGTLAVSVGNDNLMRLWEVASGTLLHEFPEQPLPITCVAFSPDGRIVTGDSQGNLWSCEATPGAPVTKQATETVGVIGMSPSPKMSYLALRTMFRGHEVRAASDGGIVTRRDTTRFSPDNRWAITSRCEHLRSWDAATGNPLPMFEAHSEQNDDLKCVALSPDGGTVVSGSNNGLLQVSELSSGKLLRTFEIPARHSYPLGVVFSPDGRNIITANTDATLRVRDVETGKVMHTFADRDALTAAPVTSVAISRDGRTIAAGSYDSTVRLWNIETGSALRKLEGHTAPVICVAFHPTRELVVSGSSDQNLRLWDAESGKLAHVFMGHTSMVNCVGFSPDGRTMASASSDKTVRLWSPDSGKLLHTLYHPEPVRSLVFSPDGRTIVSGSNDHLLRIWDADTGKLQRTIQGNAVYLTCIALSKHGRTIVSGGHSQETIPQIVELATGATIDLGRAQADESVSMVAFSPDSRVLLTCVRRYLDNTEPPADADTKPATRLLRYWDTQSGRLLRTFDVAAKNLTCTGFAPDGRRVFAGSSTGKLWIWDAEDGRELHRLVDGEDSVMGAAFSPDGRTILAGSNDTLRLWDASSGKLLHRLSLEGGAAHSFEISRDGRTLLSLSSSREVRLWDTASGALLRTIDDARGNWCSDTHCGFFGEGSLIADDRIVLSTSSDYTLRLIDIATGDLIANIVPLTTDGWLVITPEGLFDGPTAAQQKVSYRIGDGFNIVSVDRFHKDFYYPGLLSAILRGERPMPQAEFGQSLPPSLRIARPAQAGAVDQLIQEVVLEATDTGGGIAPPWLMHNGARVLGMEKEERDGNVLRQTYHVRLVQGGNELKFQSASADGSWESEPVSMLFNYSQPIQKPELYVLAIGINQYADEAFNLKYAAGDAQAIAEVFRQRGGNLYSQVHAIVLNDAQATTRGIQEAVEQMSQTARPQDTMLTFLAGHGTTVGQRYYFIPHEYQDLTGIPLEQDVQRDGLAGDDLEQMLRKSRALKRIVIYDTCQSNVLNVGERDAFALQGAIERLKRVSGMHIIAAVPPGEQAKEVDELGHGVLTYALLAGLGAVESGPLKDTHISSDDQIVTTRQWFDFAEEQVPRLMERYYGRSLDPHPETDGVGFPVLTIERN